MFEDAIYYPSRGEQSTTTIVIGGLLSVFSWLLVPLLFLFGFFIRVLERTTQGRSDVPEFDDWGDLAVKGLIGFAITIVFYLIPAVVFFVLGGLGALTGSGDIAFASFALAALVSFVLVVALTYVYPAALTNYAAGGSFGDAFAFGKIKGVVTSSDYVGAWVIGFLLFLGGWFVVAVLSIIPFIGTIVGLFINFYIQTAAYRAFGTAYARADPASTAPRV